MSQSEKTQALLELVGQLAAISIGQKINYNSVDVRLTQMKSIIQWTKEIKQNYEAENDVNIQLENEINRLKSHPAREDMLLLIDRSIQSIMQQLNVDIRIGTQLLPKIMKIVEKQMDILIQEIDDVTRQANNLVAELDLVNVKVQELRHLEQDYKHYQQISNASSPRVTVVESQSVTTSQDIRDLGSSNQVQFLTNQVIQNQEIINKLQQDLRDIQSELDQARTKNQDLVNQISFSNSKIIQFQKSIQLNSQNINQSTTRSTINNQTNDANIRIINQLKTQLNVKNQKNNELIQQVVAANSKIQELKKKLSQKSTNTTPAGSTSITVQQNNQYKTIFDIKVKELQTELIAKQEEINNLSTSLRNSQAKTNELINELMSSNGQVVIWRNKYQTLHANFSNQNFNNSESMQSFNQLQNQYHIALSKIKLLESEQAYVESSSSVKNNEMIRVIEQHERHIVSLTNQLTNAKDKIQVLEIDLKMMTDDRLKNNGPNLVVEKGNDSITHALMISESKVKEMMKIVANYQNNVIDLELDKESLGTQLNDARNRQQDYLDDLKVERASVSALKEQIIKIKEEFRGIARENLRTIEDQIADKAHLIKSVHKPSNDLVETYQNRHELQKSERSHRGHRKIFQGQARGSRASHTKEVYVQK